MAKKKHNKEKSSQANEPESAYSNKSGKIVFFNSFEEMNEYDIKQMALAKPVENLQQVTEMLKRFFADELKQPLTNLKIQYK